VYRALTSETSSQPEFSVIMLRTLAWAYGSSITAVEIDRFLARIIMGDTIDSGSLPTLSFIASVLLAFATGTSRGTMALVETPISFTERLV
jgi:Na+/H+ antiporter NhaC